MNEARAIVFQLLEADETDDVKELAFPDQPEAGRTKVKRHGRWKVVDMRDFQFLISYLTPVGYIDKRTGVIYVTSKRWSPTTNQHIRDWLGMIQDTPEWKNDPENQVVEMPTPETPWRTEPYRYVRYPKTVKKRQKKISALFRSLMPTMQMKPHEKRRMYHVDPRMRTDTPETKRARWLSGHLKHHDTGQEGLPRPDDYGFRSFFTDFDPHDPEYWSWQGSSYRDQEPYEPDERQDR